MEHSGLYFFLLTFILQFLLPNLNLNIYYLTNIEKILKGSDIKKGTCYCINFFSVTKIANHLSVTAFFTIFIFSLFFHLLSYCVPKIVTVKSNDYFRMANDEIRLLNL